MPLPIENHAMIGNCRTAALVGGDGSIDWLCFPRFDSGACFAALLGGPEHGRWLIAPADATVKSRRRYRKDTLVLETDFETGSGTVRLIDFMPIADHRADVVRTVEGLTGSVAMHMELVIRFDYGSIIPWVHRTGGKLQATAGPDTLELAGSIAVCSDNMKSTADFRVTPGERVHFTLSYRRSCSRKERGLDAEQALQQTDKHWRGDSVAPLVTAGTVPASRPLGAATTFPFSAAVLRSSACRWALRVTLRCLLHTDSTPLNGLRTAPKTPPCYARCGYRGLLASGFALPWLGEWSERCTYQGAGATPCCDPSSP